MYVLLAVVLVALLIIVVVLIRRKRAKGEKTFTDETLLTKSLDKLGFSLEVKVDSLFSLFSEQNTDG